MTTTQLENINIASFDPMPSPGEIQARATSASAGDTVAAGRQPCATSWIAAITGCSSSLAPAPFTTRWPALSTPAA